MTTKREHLIRRIKELDTRLSIQIKVKYDREWEEYQVQWIENGKLDKEKTYHTDDSDDAYGTKKAMMQEAHTATDLKLMNLKKAYEALGLHDSKS